MAVMTSTIKVLAELAYERHQAIISALSIVSKNYAIIDRSFKSPIKQSKLIKYKNCYD
jgi:hypothetical protein